MKLITYDDDRIGASDDGESFVAIDDLISGMRGSWPPVGMVQLVAGFDGYEQQIKERLRDGERKPLASVALKAPISWPNKLIAFPANYDAHISEMKDGLVSTFKASGQGFFLKANSSLSGPSEPIQIPPLEGREVHHEAELAIIIGKGGRGISPEDAMKHIFGYSCLLDIVVRGKEERVMRKSFDSFCPLGPWIITSDEVGDPNALDLTLHVNGELRQQANTRDLIVDIPGMISMASSVMTLYPGDVIATGTPAGVAPIVDGDQLDIMIDRVGTMRVHVADSPLGAHPVWDKPV